MSNKDQLEFGRRCAHCGSALEIGRVKRGTVPKFCGTRCRVAAHRRKNGSKPRSKNSEK